MERESYDKAFEELSIGDTFLTPTGEWKVYDKGTKTIVAHKKDQDSSLELIVFEWFEFTLSEESLKSLRMP